MQQLFEWDKNKAEANLRKHGVSFHEAQTVFTDELSIMIPDPEHSDEEDRCIMIGISHNHRVLVVSYMERAHRFRLISARRATRAEREKYAHEDF